MRMPFGKWAGYALEDIPDSYLEWLQGLDNLKRSLRRAVEDELDCRGIPYDPVDGWQPPPPPPPRNDQLVLPLMKPAEKELFSSLVTAGYRALSRKLHPDVPGGSTEEMQLLNLLMERLRREKIAL